LIIIYRRVVHIQALLDSLTVMLVFFMAYALLPFRAAFLSALLAAFNPHLIVMCAYLLSETLYTFLLAAGMLFMVLAAKKMRYPMFLAAGLLLGLATLTRPALFLFPFIALPLTAILTGNRTRSFLKNGALLLAAFLIVQAPWAIRNLGVHPPPGRDVNVLRASFIHGSYPGFVYKDPRYYGYPYRDDPRYKEMEASWDRTFEILGQRIAAEPLKYAAWYFGGKVIALWQWDMRAGGAGDLYTYPHQTDGFRQINFLKILRSAYRLLYPLVLIAGFSGFVYYLVRKRWRDPAEAPFLPVPILLFYFAGIHTVLAPFPRYSIPLRPYILVLAVYGSLAAVQRFFKETSD
jgi:4-amino-4-deoxy-L-arabinose transferase-like glycosyltransferase